MSTWCSMTGYGAAEAEFDDQRLTVELRTVNQKNRETRVYSSPKNLAWEHAIQQCVSGRLARGKIDVRVTVEAVAGKGQLSGSALNRIRAEIYNQKLVLGQQNINPNLIYKQALEHPDQPMVDQDTLLAVVEEAIVALIRSRGEEGTGLRQIVSAQKDQLVEGLTSMTQLQAKEKEVRQNLLKDKFETLRGAGLTEGDRKRLEEELVVQLIRADVTEEIDRLKLHLDKLVELLDRSSPVGKQLDVLSQEIGREVHTLCSKSGYPPAKEAAMQMRPVVDQLREQVQNIE